MDIPEKYNDLLQSNALANIATIGPEGAPQNNPVWFEYDGEHIKFSQTQHRQKLRNLERDPRIAITIVDPTNPFRYVEIRGAMAKVEPDPDNAFINKMAKKYMGQDVYPWHKPGDQRMVVYVKPERSLSMG